MKLQRMPQTSSQMPQCRHKCLESSPNFLSITFWSSKSLISWKMRPHSGSYFLYCPQICHPLIWIDSNQRKLSRNDPGIPEFSPSINSNRHAIVVYAPNDPEFIINRSEFIATWPELYHMPPNRLRLVANRLKSSWKLSIRLRIVAKKLMIHPLVSRRTAMP